MNTMDRERQILQDVADGRLSPEEAAALLDEVDSDEGSDEGDDADEEHAEEPGSGGISRVQVNGTFNAVKIIGDPTVREAVAEGAYIARREGETLVIENEWEGVDLPGFVFAHGGRRWHPTHPPRPPRPDSPWEGLFAWTGGGSGPWRPNKVTVRMRPDLPLDAEINGGSIRVDRIHGPLRIAIAAGSAKVSDARGPIDLEVNAGSVKLETLLTEGTSRIRCDAGSARVHLLRGSSVRVRARADFGKLTLPDGETAKTWVAGGGSREVVVGAGNALLDVKASLGNVTVTAD
jgi:hypothetical protein